MRSASTRPLARLDLAIIVSIILLAVVARALPGPRTIDDAFITFRYSRNIVEGQGFVYNPGSQVLGTTTPLFTVLMAAISAVLGGQQDFQWYAIAVSAVADAGTAVLLFLLARKLTGNRWIAALLGGLWAIAPMSVTFAVGGMETSVNIFWMVAAVWCFVENRPVWMGVVAALGILTRIDAAIWIGLLFAYQLFETLRSAKDSQIINRIPWKTWLAFAITFTPWLIFSLLYFGSPFPRSLTAKTVAYIMPPGAALVTFIRTFSTPFFEFETFGSIGAMAGSVVYLTLSLLGIFYAAKRIPRLLPFLVYPWIYLIVFSAANPLIFRWYVAAPMPGYMLGIIAGAWSLIELIQQTAKKTPIVPVAVALLALLWGGMSINAWDQHPDHIPEQIKSMPSINLYLVMSKLQQDHEPDRPAPNMAWHQIEILYEQVGNELRESYGVTPEIRVASADIGAVGYFSRATIVDTVGLVTPALSKYYPVAPGLIAKDQNYAIPPQLIKDTQPAYLVTMEAFVRNGLEQDPEFKATYQLIKEIPTTFYGTGMRVYQRIAQ
jgi:hypothetical protein